MILESFKHFRGIEKGKRKSGAEQAGRGSTHSSNFQRKRAQLNNILSIRRTSAPTEPSGHDESSSLYAELGLTESDTKSDKEVPPIVKSGAPDEGQSGPNPGESYANGGRSSNSRGACQLYRDVTTADTKAESMVSVTIHQDTSAIPPMTSPVMDLVSVLNSPTVHRPLPTTTTATATATTTIMTTIPLPHHPQQVSSDSILLNCLGELKQHQGQRMHQLETKDLSRMIRKQTDLPTSDMKEILLQRMLEENYDKVHEDHKMVYEALQKSIIHDESEQFDADKAEERTKNKKRQDSPKTPPGSPPYPLPPPPPPAGPSGTSGASGASGSYQLPPPPPPPSNNQGGHSTSTAAPNSLKTAASAEYMAWTTTDTRIKPSVSPIPEELHMDDDTMVDEQAYSSSSEDVRRDHIPTVNLRQSWWKPLTEDRPATPEPAWSIPSSDLTVPTKNWASALKSTYTPPPENLLLAQIGDMA
ncbi:hypothetical protein Tco_0414337, partial [Tanacetum coccineum]